MSHYSDGRDKNPGVDIEVTPGHERTSVGLEDVSIEVFTSFRSVSPLAF